MLLINNTGTIHPIPMLIAFLVTVNSDKQKNTDYFREFYLGM